MKSLVRTILIGVGLVLLIGGILFARGMPRTKALKNLSEVPGLLVYADETIASEAHRKITSLIESMPILPDKSREFLLQYCEAQTSKIVVRSMHPLISLEEIRKLDGLEIANYIDFQCGDDADQVAAYLAVKVPRLKILHLQGKLGESGFRSICTGFPNLTELYLIDANLSEEVIELKDHLEKLEGITFSQCNLTRVFERSLEKRPDVKIAIE